MVCNCKWLICLALLVAVVSGCASQKYVKRGHAALARGDVEEARDQFEQALRRSPRLAKDAEFFETLRVTRRDAELSIGQRDLGRGAWLAAIEHLRKSLEAESDYAPAAAALAQAHRGAADMFYRAALDQADRGDLNAAREELTRSLQHVTDHADAAAAKASLTPDAEPAASYDQAVRLAAKQDWDPAISTLRQTIVDHPNHLPARATLHQTKIDAADDMARLGRSAIAAKRFEEADGLFSRLLQYRPNDPRAARGLADADLGRARLAEEAGWQGAALLWARAAAGHIDDRQARQSERKAHRTLLAQHQPAAQLYAVEQTSFKLATAALANAGNRVLDTDHSDAMGPRHRGLPVGVSIDDLSIERLAVKTQRRRFAYEALQSVPNPLIVELKRKIHHKNKVCRDLARREAYLCDALIEAEAACDDYKIARIQDKLRRLRHDLATRKNELRYLRYELECAPATVLEPYTAYCPYTVEIHGQQGTLHTSFEVEGLLKRHTIGADYEEKDTAILDPRPDLGLYADGVDLAPRSHVQHQLIERAAVKLADRIAASIVTARVNQLDDDSARLAAAGDADGARENAVAAAVVLSTRDSEAAAKRLDALQINDAPQGQ